MSDGQTQYIQSTQPVQLVTLQGGQILQANNGQQIQLIQSGNSGNLFTSNGQQIITLKAQDGNIQQDTTATSQPQQQQAPQQQQQQQSGSNNQGNNQQGASLVIQGADGSNNIIQMASIPTMSQGGQLVMMIPNPVSSPKSMAQLPQQAEVTEEEPLYVNAKQYNRILKRRKARGRLEAAGLMPKERKKYLHESRHKHAMARQRGDGGRFHTANNNAERKKSSNERDIPSRPLYQQPRQNLQPATQAPQNLQQGQTMVTSTGQQIRFVQATPGQTMDGQQMRQVFATQQSNGTTYELNGQTFQLVPTPSNKIIQLSNGGREFVTLQEVTKDDRQQELIG